jgi:voltage-gated sodium channel
VPSLFLSQARVLHDSEPFQNFFGAVILSSFLVSLVRTEMVPPSGSPNDEIFEIVDFVFTGLFTIELAVTWVAFWFFEFFRDGWHIFDAAIVGVSLASAVSDNIPGVNSIRAVRVLRALRLVKLLESTLYSACISQLN